MTKILCVGGPLHLQRQIQEPGQTEITMRDVQYALAAISTGKGTEVIVWIQPDRLPAGAEPGQITRVLLVDLSHDTLSMLVSAINQDRINVRFALANLRRDLGHLERRWRA